MRTQASIVPTFWTGGSGAKLRGKSDAQVLAFYLMTSPLSSMLGLYYESLHSILHHTGLTEAAFREALPLVSEIALYDEEAALVFLPEGSCYQLGPTLSAGDKKRKGLLSQLKVYRNHDFVRRWVERYYDCYNLSQDGITKPLRSPFEAPSKGHARTVHAPETEAEAEAETDPISEARAGAGAPIIVSLRERSQAWVRDPMAASMSYPNPHLWTETLELVALVATTFGIEPDALRPPGRNGSLDGRVQLVLERWAEGVDQARMRQAVRGAKHSDLIAGKPELQSLQTIFKDGNAVDKYCRLAKSKDHPATQDKSNRVTLTPEAAEKRRKFLAGE